MQPSRKLDDLLAIMAALRTPVSGCPWDLEQTFQTIAPYTVEEAYEVLDAVDRADMDDLRDELGDLLLQVVFHARMAEEQGTFAFGDVVEAITAKLIRRHPYVFGEADASGAADVKRSWEEIKAGERAAKARGGAPASALDGVSAALPGLSRALKLQARAGRVGFDWQDARLVLGKIAEETAEVQEALDSAGREEQEEEIGDLLFAVVNLARHLTIDPEAAMRRANSKFERRFRAVEAALSAQGKHPAQSSLDEMETLWRSVKREEKRGS
jgi:nucleoside triphosphate diphosphatase